MSAPGGRILGLHHVSLLISDTARSLAFYQGVLGLAQAERPDLAFPGAWLTVGGQQIHLLELPDPCAGGERPAHGGRDRHLALTVDDMDRLIERLQRAGIEFGLSRSGRRALFCRDPDGNVLELIDSGQ